MKSNLTCENVPSESIWLYGAQAVHHTHSRLKAWLRLCVSIDSCLRTVNAIVLMRASSKGDLQRPACASRAPSCNSPAQTRFCSSECSLFPNRRVCLGAFTPVAVHVKRCRNGKKINTRSKRKVVCQCFLDLYFSVMFITAAGLF